MIDQIFTTVISGMCVRPTKATTMAGTSPSHVC